MATVYSTQRTTLTQDDPSDFVKANELGGEVRVAHGTYEASSLASGDVIEMFALPNGARILQGQLAHDALGSSTTLSVGFAAHTEGRRHSCFCICCCLQGCSRFDVSSDRGHCCHARAAERRRGRRQ